MRRALFSIILVGIVAIGATVGGLAAFNDTETSEGNTFQAGELDLQIDWTENYNGSQIEQRTLSDLADGEGETDPIFSLDDVKPGDSGEATISLHVFTNDAWVCGEISPVSNDDMSTNEPESLVDNEDVEADNWDGELAQNIDMKIWLENDGNNEYNESNEILLFSDKASELSNPFMFNMDQNLNTDDGIQPLKGCENYYVGISWSIDTSVGNEIQSDEFAFDIKFDAYQRRHQDQNPCENISCEDLETLYLSDSGLETDDGVGAKLFDVTLDDSENRAYLTELIQLNGENFDQVDAIAASDDGENIYCIDKFSKHLGIYNVVSETFVDKGEIDDLPNGVVLAAFSPDGDLYAASDDTNELYTIDIGETPSATSVGQITTTDEETLDIMGADLVFDAEGTLYVYVNSDPEPGLYEIDNMDNMVAVDKGSPGEHHYFTGVAIRAAGTGDLVGSTHLGEHPGFEEDHSPIYQFSPDDATVGTAFETYIGDTEYDVGYGDMTVGTLCVFPDGSSSVE